MNVKRLFWRLWFGNRKWSKYKTFGVDYCPAQLGGIDYCGIVLFGYALIYSINW